MTGTLASYSIDLHLRPAGGLPWLRVDRISAPSGPLDERATADVERIAQLARIAYGALASRPQPDTEGHRHGE